MCIAKLTRTLLYIKFTDCIQVSTQWFSRKLEDLIPVMYTVKSIGGIEASNIFFKFHCVYYWLRNILENLIELKVWHLLFIDMSPIACQGDYVCLHLCSCVNCIVGYWFWQHLLDPVNLLRHRYEQCVNFFAKVMNKVPKIIYELATLSSYYRYEWLFLRRGYRRKFYIIFNNVEIYSIFVA